MGKVLEQGLYFSENEMSQMAEAKKFILYKFATITLEVEILTKSKLQTVEDYLNFLVMKKKLQLKIG